MLLVDLVVELIKEDMGVGDEEVRVVLEDSKELGDFVYEDF